MVPGNTGCVQCTCNIYIQNKKQEFIATKNIFLKLHLKYMGCFTLTRIDTGYQQVVKLSEGFCLVAGKTMFNRQLQLSIIHYILMFWGFHILLDE